MRNASLKSISLATLAVLCCAGLAIAQVRGVTDADVAAPAKAPTNVYIVQLEGNPAVAYEGGEYGLAATRPARGEKIDPSDAAVQAYVQHLISRHDQMIASVGGEKAYSYCYTFNGFAARLTGAQLTDLRARPDVVRVWKDELLQPTTDTSPAFLGLSPKKGVWERDRLLGEDIVIGMIDTGIWPEHESFASDECDDSDSDSGSDSDSDSDCKPYKFKSGVKAKKLDSEQAKAATYGPPSASYSGDGCDFGNDSFIPLHDEFTCNNKLIGARFYAGGFSTGGVNPDGSGGNGAFLVPDEFLSARDSDGHGSHTSSTAGGNLHVPASIGGEELGRVSGIAPRARISTYKVCWDGTIGSGCFSSDSMAAIDQAVADGVDVINFSIGGSGTNFNGADDIAFLFASDAGVFVATSNGNAGPGAQTTGTPAGVPWITAVGAAQDDQVFGTGLSVSAPGSIAGTYAGIEGVSPVRLSDTGDISAAVVPSVPANGCAAFTNGAAINNNIALVIRGACSFSTKYNNAAAVGALAIVVYNDGANPARIDPITMSAPGTSIPGIMIGFNDGTLIAGTAGVSGTVGPSIQISRANRIAGFSSRGPNGGEPDIIKPDIAAPGVRILAAETPIENSIAGPGGELFQIISGTSMSSPHACSTPRSQETALRSTLTWTWETNPTIQISSLRHVRRRIKPSVIRFRWMS